MNTPICMVNHGPAMPSRGVRDAPDLGRALPLVEIASNFISIIYRCWLLMMDFCIPSSTV